jgi:hypothetical protein
MPMALIDRIGLALLLEPMTLVDLAIALHAAPRSIAIELRWLTDSKKVCTRSDRVAELKPIYFLTRQGRQWAESAINQEKTA